MSQVLFMVSVATTAAFANAVGIGGGCFTNDSCTITNSHCRYVFTTASCPNGACACNPGFSGITCDSPDKFKGYAEGCVTLSDCITELTCINKLCKCATSTYTYRESINTCISPAMKAFGETCSQTSDCYNVGGATNGMICKNLGAMQQCACATGFIHMNGLCEKPYYGQACISSGGCRQRTLMFANTDSSRETEVCPTNGGICTCPPTSDSITYTYAGTKYTVCLQQTTAALLANGARCTASNQCASKICSTCLDGTSSRKCVTLGSSSRIPAPTAVLLLTVIVLQMFKL